MGTKRCEHLLRRIRQRSDNEDYGTEAGISDEQIVDYLNDGLEKLQSVLAEQHSEIFGVSANITLVPGQEEYDLPEDMLEGAGLLLVEHKFDAQYYKKLDKLSIAERSSGSQADPFGYIRKGRKILLRPVPYRNSSDVLRIEYARRWDRIGKRRGSVAVNTTGVVTELQINYLNYDTGDTFRDTDLRDADRIALSETDHVCIVDRDGNFIVRNIPIDLVYVLGNIRISIDNFDLEGVTIPMGSYIVCEKDTSTHQQELDRTVERYLLEYAVWRCKSQDASNEAYEQQGYLKSIQNDILASYAILDDTVQYVPELPEY